MSWADIWAVLRDHWLLILMTGMILGGAMAVIEHIVRDDDWP